MKQDAALIASYENSKLIAKSRKPHTVGEEVIKPSISIFLQTVLQKNNSIAAQILPSNDSFRGRIGEMFEDAEFWLVSKLKTHKFSLQLDESAFCGSEVLLLAYVRYIENDDLQGEILFCKAFETTTTSTDIYNIVTDYFAENDIPLTLILSCGADSSIKNG